MLNGRNKKKKAVKSPGIRPNLFLIRANRKSDEKSDAKIVTSLPHSSSVKTFESLKSPA
jgi:hypothetical protein